MLMSIPTDLQPLLTAMLAPAEADRPTAQMLAQQAQQAQDRYLLDIANNSAQVSSDEHIRSAVWCLCRISRPVFALCVSKARKKVQLGGIKRECCCSKCGVECEFGYTLHCKKHVVCLDHAQIQRRKPCLWQLCLTCREPEYIQLPMSLFKNEVDTAVMFLRVKDSFETLGRETAEELLKNCCHWCHGPLQRDWLYVPHNSAPAFVCSKQCPVLAGTDICPVCSTSVNQLFIQQVSTLPDSSIILYTDSNGMCGLCRLRSRSVKFDCGCQLCEQCLKKNYQSNSATHFPCIRCGMMLQIAEYSQFLRNWL